MKLNKLFNPAKFKNVGSVILYMKEEGYGTASFTLKYYYDPSFTKEVTADDLKKLFLSGKLVVASQSALGGEYEYYKPCGITGSILCIPQKQTS